jgi:serine/threonine protein phosphatase 1
MEWDGPAMERIEMDGPVAVVGDIHGCREALDELIGALGGIPLLFLGDLVDRGPDSRGVVQRMIDIGARGVRGNHEEWFAAWAAGATPAATAIPMFGEETLVSYGITPGELPGIGSGLLHVPEAHRRFVASLPVAIDLRLGEERYWLTHAGIPREQRLHELLDDPGHRPHDPALLVPWLAEHERDALLWVKTLPEDMPRTDRTLLFGHTSFPLPIDLGHVIALDTGAGRWDDAQLTAIVLPERRFVRVWAR